MMRVYKLRNNLWTLIEEEKLLRAIREEYDTFDVFIANYIIDSKLFNVVDLNSLYRDYIFVAYHDTRLAKPSSHQRLIYILDTFYLLDMESVTFKEVKPTDYIIKDDYIQLPDNTWDKTFTSNESILEFTSFMTQHMINSRGGINKLNYMYKKFNQISRDTSSRLWN